MSDKQFNFVESSTEDARRSVRSHAASYGHVTRRLGDDAAQIQVPESSLEPGQFMRQRLSKWTEEQAKPRKRALKKKSTSTKDEEGSASREPLESRLLVPYTRPVFLVQHDWIDDALEQYLHISFSKLWLAMDLDQQLGFKVDMFTNWIRHHALLDPALFCLQACAATFTELAATRLNLQNAFWLKAETIHQINLALSDPRRQINSLSILAVLWITACEAWTGDRNIAKDVHIPALKRMLELKGGETVLEGDLPAFVILKNRWYSQTIAMLCGVEPVLSPLQRRVGDVVGTMRTLGDGKLGNDLFDKQTEEVSGVEDVREEHPVVGGNAESQGVEDVEM